MVARLCQIALQDKLLLSLLLALPPLWWVSGLAAGALPGLIHWSTIAALAGFMILSKALDDSGYLSRAGRMALLKLSSERSLALFLVLFAAALSTVITNDVALFITVPLTLGLRLMAQLPLARLVIFQALAVNAGSALSPIGNPQNLYLWQQSALGFFEFVRMMAPLTLGLMLLLIALIPLAFRARPLMLADVGASPPADRRLLWALPAYLPLILLVEAGQAIPATLATIGLFLLLRPRLLADVDWLLLLVFVLMFLNLGLLARWPPLVAQFNTLNDAPGTIYWVGVGLSQLISNVPAAIFLAEFSSDWRALAWGVSVGGFGLAIGSMANLIALRLAREPGIWLDFHRWSLPLLALAAGLGWLLL
ncbi:MAG: SLC13 family permease [Wenzhouxiangella sp.]